MAIVAGYASVRIDRLTRGGPVAFFACDVIVHGVFFMRYYMADKTVSSAIEMRFDGLCLRYERFARHMTSFTNIFWYENSIVICSFLQNLSLIFRDCFSPHLVFSYLLIYKTQYKQCSCCKYGQIYYFII